MRWIFKSNKNDKQWNKDKKNIKQYEIKRIKMEDGKYEVWEHLDIIIHQLHCMISFYL